MPDPAPNPDAYPRLRHTVTRWRARHPALAQPPDWPILAGMAALLALAALVALPFLIPAGGPEPVAPAALADPNGFFVRVDDETLYTVHTPGPGPAVVLLHGFGGSTVTWDETMPALAAAGYDVYALDLRGFGLSDKGLYADYSHAAQARRVAAWMDAVGIKQAAVVGHSMGGVVAARLALSAPGRVSRLVLVDAPLLDDSMSWMVPGWVFDVPFLRRWAQIALRRALPSFSGDLLRASVADPDRWTPELLARYERALRTPGWDLGLLGLVRDSRRNTPPPVSQLRVPTLIVWGAEDAIVPPGEGARLAQRIPGAERLELAGVGHMPMHEAPEAFQAALLDFLDRDIP